MAASPIRISVIVPAYNCADALRRCLTALAAQSSAADEILVVDDASTDGTAEVATRVGVRVVSMPGNGGPAAARNRGAAVARGDVLLFVDADVVVPPGTIGRVRETFARDPELAALFGSYDASPAAPGLISRYRNLLHHFVHQEGNPNASTFWAGLGAIRRPVFIEVGGFDADRYPRPAIEDIELGYRLKRAGYRLRLDRRLQATHLKEWTFRSMVHTDIVYRALPWARLLLEHPTIAADLNLRPGQRISAVFVGLALVSLGLAPLAPGLLAVSAVCFLVVLALNRRFYALLLRGGLGFTVGALPLHMLYFVYCGATGLYARVEWPVRSAAMALQKLARSVRA